MLDALVLVLYNGADEILQIFQQPHCFFNGFEQ